MVEPAPIPDLPCPSCGYDLGDAPIINGAKLCPECGRSYNTRFLTRRLEEPTFGLLLIRMCLIPACAAAACVSLVLLAFLLTALGVTELALALAGCAGIAFIVTSVGMPFAGVWAVESRPLARTALIVVGLTLNAIIGVVAFIAAAIVAPRI